MQLTGDLQKVNLLNLLQLVSRDNLTGKLDLKSDKNEQAQVFFESGAVTHAQMGAVQGKHLVMELLLWNQGSFNLLESDKAVATQTSIEPHKPDYSMKALLDQGAAYVEQQDFLEQIGISEETIFSPSPQLPSIATKFDSATQKLLQNINGKNPLASVFTLTALPRYIMVASVYQLLVERLIAVSDQPESLKTLQLELPDWVLERLRQSDGDAADAIVNLLIRSDQLSAWLHKADSELARLANELRG
jgi:hypothetical protein